MTLPGGEISKRELHFIWIVDCSGSMRDDGKIQALNYAIKEAIPHMQRESENNIQANLLISALKFSTGAQWIIAPTRVNEFNGLILKQRVKLIWDKLSFYSQKSCVCLR